MNILSLVSLGGVFALGLLASLGEGSASASPPTALDEAPVCRDATEADRQNYALSMSLPERCKVGQQCVAVVTIEAKGDRRLSKDFDFTFQAPNPAPKGVKYPRPTLGRKDGSFDEKRGTIRVPFIASAAGQVKVEGKQSVKEDELKCVMDKVDLALDVDPLGQTSSGPETWPVGPCTRPVQRGRRHLHEPGQAL